jgi:para-aminobenzoate synthetase component 1
VTQDGEAVAAVGGRYLTGLSDLTSDLSALDSGGLWVVVLPFDGAPICARFDHTGAKPITTWRGPHPEEWSSSLDADQFKAGVEAIRQAIANGNVYQVNLCRVLTAPVSHSGADILALADVLQAGNPAPYAAAVRIPSIGLHVACASPECFLRRDGDWVESSPIKGTAATKDGFLAKDHAENVMIVDLVRNDLGRVCAYGSISVPRLCEVEAHPGLFHLVSTVRGRLTGGQRWGDLIGATFPPGSVTGAPKLASLDVIAALEPASRGPYCGAIGWVDADQRLGDLGVAIRTFWIDDRRLHFGTGGGITWDSTPEGEWQETVLKAKRLIGLASTPAPGAVPARPRR